MMFNDKNLWRNRGFLAHGMKENQKTYWKDELSLLLSEAPSVTTRYRDWETDRKSTRLNSSHSAKSRRPSSA